MPIIIHVRIKTYFIRTYQTPTSNWCFLNIMKTNIIKIYTWVFKKPFYLKVSMVRYTYVYSGNRVVRICWYFRVIYIRPNISSWHVISAVTRALVTRVYNSSISSSAHWGLYLRKILIKQILIHITKDKTINTVPLNYIYNFT